MMRSLGRRATDASSIHRPHRTNFLKDHHMRSLSTGPQSPQLDQPQPESPKQDMPKQEAPKQDLSNILQPNTPQRTLSQETQTIALDLQREPGIKRPISDNPEHPVNSQGSSVYFSRTNNLAGLSVDQQAQKLADSMRSIGPGRVMLLEASGPAGGSYVEELRKALPKALEMVPPDQRPEIRLFVSDGRPLMPAREAPGAEPSLDGPKKSANDLTNFLLELEKQKPGSGIVAVDTMKNGMERAVPNWANPEVAKYFIEQRVEPAIALAKELGLKSVVMDDHIGIPPDSPNGKPPTRMMSEFKERNGNLTNGQVENIITGIYKQGLQKINDAGLDAGLSTAADPSGSLRFGINMNKLAGLSDTIEIQAYRPQLSSVTGMTNDLLQNVRSNFDQYKNVKEIKIALTTEPNGVKLTENQLIQQQDVIDIFKTQINAEYKKRGVEPPEVTTSLWAHQHFYK
jgi:hypothetical protein